MRHTGIKLGDKPYKNLHDIFNNKGGCEGLLDSVRPKKVKKRNMPNAIVQKFEAINRFVSNTGRVPDINAGDPTEAVLAASLNAIKKDSALVEQLKPTDENNLL